MVMQDNTEQCVTWLMGAPETQHHLPQAAAGHCQAYTACASTAAQCVCSATGSSLSFVGTACLQVQCVQSL